MTALFGIAAAIANAKEFISTPCVQDSFEFLLGVVGILVKAIADSSNYHFEHC